MVRGLTLDSAGNIVVTGYTLSSDFPVTADAVQPAYAGNGDVFVSVLNYTNSQFVLYSTYLGGADGEVAYAVTTDSSGYIYVTGYTLSTDFPVTADTVQGAWGHGTSRAAPESSGPPSSEERPSITATVSWLGPMGASTWAAIPAANFQPAVQPIRRPTKADTRTAFWR
jgi:hypothetical protein